MNNQYLSFWQSTMSDVFNTDKQAQALNNILNQTFSQFDEITSHLTPKKGSAVLGDMNAFTKPFDMQADFLQDSFKKYLEFFGLISTSEYKALVKKYEKLKSENKSLQSKTSQQAKKTSSSDKTIDSQKKKIANYESDLKKLKNDLAGEKKEASGLKKEIIDFKKRISELEKDLAAAPKKTKNS